MNQNTMRAATVSTLALIAACATAQQVQVTVNGNAVQFQNAQPQMVDGRVLVPFRGVFEQMGATVDWDPSTRTIMADGNGRHVRLQVGSLDASVDGHVVSMAVAPQIVNDSTMVPLRFLSESLGGHVDWQPQTETVAITTPPPNQGAAQPIAPPPPPPPPPTLLLPQRSSSTGNPPPQRHRLLRPLRS